MSSGIGERNAYANDFDHHPACVRVVRFDINNGFLVGGDEHRLLISGIFLGGCATHQRLAQANRGEVSASRSQPVQLAALSNDPQPLDTAAIEAAKRLAKAAGALRRVWVP